MEITWKLIDVLFSLNIQSHKKIEKINFGDSNISKNFIRERQAQSLSIWILLESLLNIY